jgi:antitoxin MazE
MRTAVTKWGNSQGVRIPRNILDDAKIMVGDPVDIHTKDEIILIRKERAQKTIEELFIGYEGTYAPSEINWGRPVGNEVW